MVASFFSLYLVDVLRRPLRMDASLLFQPMVDPDQKPFSPRVISPLNKKMPDAERYSIGLGNVGIFHHDLFSIPMLLNSSELMFETSKSAPARATNTSKQITTATTNIGLSPFSMYLFNRFRFKKLYPLTVLLLILNMI
jgi:hypothetical protein